MLLIPLDAACVKPHFTELVALVPKEVSQLHMAYCAVLREYGEESPMKIVKKVAETAVGVGIGAAAAGLWALTPRPGFLRRGARALMPDVPYAHRGLHDVGSGLPVRDSAAADAQEYVNLARSMAVRAGFRQSSQSVAMAPENSMVAFAAACEAGYGIELDVQLSADGQVVVLHDATLQRVAGDPRKVRDLTYDQLRAIPLFPVDEEEACDRASSTADTDSHEQFQHVPLLSDVLDLVDGRVPLIVEYKMGNELDRDLVEKADALLGAYEGWYCMESFNPLALAWYRTNRPEILRGQLAAPAAMKLRDSLRRDDMAKWCAGNLLLNWVGRPDFVAYEWHGGSALALQAVRFFGAIPVAWTVRGHLDQLESEASFSAIIFESFVPQKL